MWEADKKAIAEYKKCYADVLSSMREGEDVDYAGMCAQETKNLQKATLDAQAYYMASHEQGVKANRQGHYKP